MIKCRRPRNKDEILVCLLDLMSKIEIYSRVQDTRNQKQDELAVSISELESEIADMKAEIDALKQQVSGLSGNMDEVLAALKQLRAL